MNRHRSLPPSRQATMGPYKWGGGREEQNVVSDQNRGLRLGQDEIKILTQIGHFHTQETTSVASLR